MLRDEEYLKDILNAARLAVQYVSGVVQDRFLDDVDPTIVWDTVREDLPPLIAQLEKVLGLDNA